MTTTEPFTAALAAFHETWREGVFGEGRCALCGGGGPHFPVPGFIDRAPVCARCHDDVVRRLGVRARPRTAEGVLRRWPRIVGHLICASLGYFTPRAAAAALLAHRNGEPFYCEWFDSLFGMDRQALIAGGAQVLKAAVADRHKHRGYMADYGTARRLVAAELEGRGPTLASWF
jgi:hypothetical protein